MAIQLGWGTFLMFITTAYSKVFHLLKVFSGSYMREFNVSLAYVWGSGKNYALGDNEILP